MKNLNYATMISLKKLLGINFLPRYASVDSYGDVCVHAENTVLNPETLHSPFKVSQYQNPHSWAPSTRKFLCVTGNKEAVALINDDIGR